MDGREGKGSLWQQTTNSRIVATGCTGLYTMVFRSVVTPPGLGE